MSDDLKIRRMLESRLADWAGERCPEIPVAYQNGKFKPPANGPYLRVFLLRARTEAPDLAGQMRTRRGILQINIAGIDQTGPVEVESIFGELEELFPVNLRLTDADGFEVQIIEPGSLGPAFPSEGRYTQPVSFTYRSDTLIDS